MTVDRPGTLLEAVTDVARLTGQVALKHFRTGLAVETKRDGSPVTIADRAAEEAARSWISARFPNDSILGEEFGSSGDSSARRWIIDPIDGTKTFVRGVPLWGTLIGVAQGETVIAGAIYCPAVDELVAAEVDEGCWWNGTRARVSTCTDVAQATLLVTDERFRPHPERGERWRALTARAAVVRTWGDCYGYVLVSTGRADVMLDPAMSLWDCAALLPVIEEAGGSFTDWKGQRTIAGGNAIATNKLLFEQVMKIVQPHANE